MKKRMYFFNFGIDEDVIDKVKKYLKSIKETGYFKGEKNQQIYYEKYIVNNAIGNIVILHGFSECIEKYTELIYYFTKEKYNVFIIEHRGHGRSGKLSEFDKTQIVVENFEFYVKDVKTFVDKIICKKYKENLYLFTHSMGGAVGAMFIEKYPEYFNKAILSSPMFNIAIGNIPICIAKIIVKIALLLGKGDNFIFGNMPYESSYDFNIASTSNEWRYSYCHKEILNNEELQRGGGSFKWLYEALSAITYIFKKKNIKNIHIPVLICEAERDELVGKNISKKFKKKCNTCKVVVFENAQHEIYSENDDILKKYMDCIFDFLEE